MYPLNTLKKLNKQKQADFENSRDGTFCTLVHGGVLIRSIRSSKVLDGDDAKAFLAKVKDKGTGYIKQVVKSYF